MSAIDTSRAEFEKHYASMNDGFVPYFHEGEYDWNDAQSCWLTWRAARAKSIGEVVVTKYQDGRIVAVTRQDDEGRILSVIATADHNEDAKTSATFEVLARDIKLLKRAMVEPQIDGYPLWSGLPPQVMSDAEISAIYSDTLGKCGNSVIAFARAILSAQSTDENNVSKKAGEIDKRPPCRNCMDTKIERGVYANTECQFCKDIPVTQPLIAEAAMDAIKNVMALIHEIAGEAADNGSSMEDGCWLPRKLEEIRAALDDVAGDAKNRIANIGTLRAILYTDEINGEPVCQDDLWLVTTKQLEAIAASKKDAP